MPSITADKVVFFFQPNFVVHRVPRCVRCLLSRHESFRGINICTNGYISLLLRSTFSAKLELSLHFPGLLLHALIRNNQCAPCLSRKPDDADVMFIRRKIAFQSILSCYWATLPLSSSEVLESEGADILKKRRANTMCVLRGGQQPTCLKK